MKKSKMILLSLFLCGILLAGIGAGVFFWEFESFTYGGSAVLGTGDLKTEVMKYELPAGEDGKKVLIYSNWSFDKVDFVEDTSLTDGTIEFELTYHKDSVEPYVMYEEQGGSDAVYEGYLYLGCHRIKGELELFFENKTQFLKDLKERKISSYEMAGWEKIVVKANPDTMKYLEF